MRCCKKGEIKSNDVVYNHDGQCRDFHVIYDDYETRDDRQGVCDDDETKMVPISEKWPAAGGVECLANSSPRHFD